MELKDKTVIVITGPTGVGKTKLSIALAKLLDGEVINADSMQVYKDLKIGTAKIKEEEKEGIKHHLFDICELDHDYNIFEYQKDCREKIEDIFKRNKTPILVGGSGLYIKSSLFDYSFKEEMIKDNYEDLSNQDILDRIKRFNSECSIHINNRKRLVRELNKCRNNNPTNKNSNKLLYNAIFIGLTTNRDELYQRINHRVDKMIQEGLIEEVENLYRQKIWTKAIQTAIGYKELYHYFDKKINKEEAIELIKKNSRNYAKRQYTFLRHQMNVNWFLVNFENFEEIINKIQDFIKSEKKLLK